MAVSMLVSAAVVVPLRCSASGGQRSARAASTGASASRQRRSTRDALSFSSGSMSKASGELVRWRRHAIASPPEADVAEGYFEPSSESMGSMVVDPTELMSTPKQTAIVTMWWALAAVMGFQALRGIVDPQSALVSAVAVVAAWVLADAGTGVFHWATDNYGNKQTPVFGNVIDAFQGHHKWPWTITKRQFANNVCGICIPAVPVQALILALQPSAPVMAFWTVFMLLVPLSQQFHSWSHLRKTAVPPPVKVLQELGVLVSCRAHGAHHRPPFEGNYCIVSGLCNNTMDNSGFFAFLDRIVYGMTGVAPRCWGFPAQVPEGATVWFGRPR